MPDFWSWTDADLVFAGRFLGAAGAFVVFVVWMTKISASERRLKRAEDRLDRLENHWRMFGE